MKGETLNGKRRDKKHESLRAIFMPFYVLLFADSPRGLRCQAAQEMDVWQKSMQLAKKVYDVTAGFSKHENYGLSSLMRRAAISIPSNIAEGAGRKGQSEFLQFMNIAQGSASKLDTQFELARMVGYLDDEETDLLTQKLTDGTKMLYGWLDQ